MPALKNVARVERASTSSGLRNSETGEAFAGSGGCHIYPPVSDAADIPRFLSDFNDRCWLAGFGWGLVSAAGSFLERSLIDKSVGSPERPIFEGPPIVEPPLVQDGREAVAHDGGVLDTRACCPPLTDTEKKKARKAKAAERQRLLPEMQAAREAWSADRAEQLIADGMSEAEARSLVDRWLDFKELSGPFPLPFDDPNLAGTTVADVLARPDDFIEKPLADPVEGPGYGRGKAIILRRADGSLIIHSFAHGGIVYKLTTNKAAGLVLPRGFRLGGDGLWFRKPDEDAPPVKVCGPFTIEARTSDDSHDNHGLLLEWIDHDCERKKWAMPRAMVHADGNAIAAQLEGAGLSCGTFPAQHNLLKQFLGAVCIKRRMCCVDRAGWHGAAFVMPDGRVLGADADSVVLQTEHAVKTGRYAARGTLNEWFDHIAKYAISNDLLALAISGAFVPPLLRILGLPSRGGNLFGASQTGKTTLVRCYISAYGPAEQKYIRNWRATANGIEGVAADREPSHSRQKNAARIVGGDHRQRGFWRASLLARSLSRGQRKRRAGVRGGAKYLENGPAPRLFARSF